MTVLHLRPDFAAALPPAKDPFEFIMELEGEVFKEMNGRRTLRFTLQGKGYFLKAHSGVGWGEILKNLFQLKAPVLGARNEWRGIQRLGALGVATPVLVGYGERGRNPAARRSFTVTEALADTVSLEQVCRDWRPVTPVQLRCKRALIRQVAAIARRLHQNGVNHRDFYLCHFLLDRAAGRYDLHAPPRLILIDLHRVQLRRATPRRWAVKDIAGLYFSAMDAGLTRRDLYRFIRVYRELPLRESLHRERRFWQAVQRRAAKLYRAHHGHLPST